MITTIDVNNPATNVIPGLAKAQFNIRFNTLHSKESLKVMLESASQPRLIFTSSGVAKKGRSFWGAYSVSKFGVKGLAEIFFFKSFNIIKYNRLINKKRFCNFNFDKLQEINTSTQTD